MKVKEVIKIILKKRAQRLSRIRKLSCLQDIDGKDSIRSEEIANLKTQIHIFDNQIEELLETEVVSK